MNKALASDGRVHGHDEVEAVLDALKEDLAVVDVDVELPLQGVVDEHAGLDVDVVILRVPVRLEGDRHAVPTFRVDVPQAVSHTLDDTLG